jgi:hypothetical protein
MLKYGYDIFYYLLFWFRNIRDYIYYSLLNYLRLFNIRRYYYCILLNTQKGGYIKLWARNNRKIILTKK